MKTEDIVELYQHGISVNYIAFLYECSPQTVRNRLKEAGVLMRSGSGKEKWKRDMKRFFGKRRN